MRKPELLPKYVDEVKNCLVERRFEDGLSLCARALVENKHSAQLWVFLGESLEQAGQIGQAWWAYERGWILDPQAAWADSVSSRVRPCQSPEAEPWLRDLLSVPAVTVAAAIIARNEEDCIGETVQRLRDAVDRVIVVDTGSSDETARVAADHGADVFHYAWTDDFSAARNFALSQVDTDWVLFVDADEQLDPADVSVPRIAAGTFSLLPNPVILRIVIMNTLSGRVQPNYDVSRFFPTKYGLRWWGRIHEQVGPPTGGPMGAAYIRPSVRIRFEHSGYDVTVMQKRDKLRRNADLLEKTVAEDPGDVASWGFLGRELFLMGRVEEGIEALKRAEVLARDVPSYARLPEVRVNLVDALLTLGRREEAVKVADDATQATPNFPGALFASGRARMDYAIHLLQEARAAFAKAIETAPQYRGVVTYDDAIVHWRAEVGIADTYKLLGDWVSALKLYEKNASLSTNPAGIRAQMDNIYRQAQQVTQIIQSNE